MTDCLQVVTTLPSEETAQALAAALVADQVAACVQVMGPITSAYRWQGAVESSQEWLCVAKTTVERYAALEQAVRQRHPYELPEIVALEITAGSADYLDWLRHETKPLPPTQDVDIQ